MSRFSAIARGTRSVRPVTLSIWGQDVAVGVRPLTALELVGVLSRSRAFSVENGVKDPREGDRLHDLSHMVQTLLVGCVDTQAEAEPFFDSAEQILANLDADRICFLYESQQMWQDECSPRPAGMTGEEFFAKVLQVAGWESGKPDPLALMRPISRLNWEHTICVRFMSLLTPSSPSGPDSSSKATDS